MLNKNLLTLVDSNVTQLNIKQVVKWNTEIELPLRASGEFEGRAFYLEPQFDWVLGYDSQGSKILVALIPQEDENPEGTLLQPV